MAFSRTIATIGRKNTQNRAVVNTRQRQEGWAAASPRRRGRHGRRPLRRARADAIELRVYPGADGRFELYEDEGEGYAYENGSTRRTRPREATRIELVFGYGIASLEKGARTCPRPSWLA